MLAREMQEAMDLVKRIYGSRTELRSVTHNEVQQYWVYDKKGQRVHAARSIPELMTELRQQLHSDQAAEPVAAIGEKRLGSMETAAMLNGSERALDLERAITITGYSRSAILKGARTGALKHEKQGFGASGKKFRYYFRLEDLREWENSKKDNSFTRPRAKHKKAPSGGYKNPVAAMKAGFRLGEDPGKRGRKPLTSSAIGERPSNHRDGYCQVSGSVPDELRDRMLSLVDRLEGTMFSLNISRIIELGVLKVVGDLEKLLK